MIYTYKTHGVCSREMRIELEDGVIKDIEIIGGCNGNLKGICALVKGCKAEEVILKLKGLTCGCKNTSCPDQLAIALGQALGK